MKKTLFLLLALFASLGISAQTVNIYGNVTDLGGTAIPNHTVYIMSDSVGSGGMLYSYYNTVQTDMYGFYSDTITNIPPASQIMFYVWTYDCNNTPHSLQGMNTNTPLNFNFSICDSSTTPNCQANFYYAGSGSQYTFTDLSIGNITNWHWDFGDGNTSTLQNPTHYYNVNGGFIVCLTVTDATSGCTSTYCDSILVNTFPQNCNAAFNFYVDSLNIPGSNLYNVYFNNQSTAGSGNYYSHWSFGDGISSMQQNPTHAYAPGVYTACLVIIDTINNCSDSVCQTIVVDSVITNPCSAYFQHNANNLTVAFFGTSSNTNPATTTYSWSFGDGSSGTGATATHTYASYGNYTVCLMINDASTGCTNTYCSTVALNNNTVTQLWGQVFAGSTPADLGWVYIADLNILTGGISFVDTTFIDSMGYYYFPQVPITPQGGLYILADLSPNSAFYNNFLPTYYGDVTSWINATAINPAQGSNPYNINLVATSPSPAPGPNSISGGINSGGSKSTLGIPAPGIEVILHTGAMEAVMYTYTDNNGNFSFDNLSDGSYYILPEHLGYTSTPILVQLDANNSNATVNFDMDNGSFTGIEDETFFSNDFSVYPNPVTDKVNISFSIQTSDNLILSVYNSQGRLISNEIHTLQAGENTISVSLDDMAGGIYHIQLMSSDGQRVQKKIVKAQ